MIWTMKSTKFDTISGKNNKIFNMKWSRSQHRTINIRNTAFIVGYILETEIFKADRTFHIAAECPIKAFEFGLSKKDD